MTLPAFAEIEDLAARLPGGVPEPDGPRAQAALDDASAKVRYYAGKTWVTEEALDEDIPDIIVTVTLTVARRAFMNGDGVNSEGVASYNVSYADASGDVFLTKEEIRQVRGAAGGNGLGVIPISRGTLDDTTWVPVVGSDEPLPVDLPAPW